MSDHPEDKHSDLNHEGLVACYNACKEFIRKVERGEAYSQRSYAEMVGATLLAEKTKTPPKGDPNV